MDTQTPCPCTSANAMYDQFRTWRSLDWDPTEGRFADVDVLQCISCSQLWLRYFVEYEAFSKSGRWARGVIPEEAARTIVPEEAAAFMRDNWLSNRVFKSYDDILDQCCFAWNRLTDQPWRIMSLGLRTWAHRF